MNDGSSRVVASANMFNFRARMLYRPFSYSAFQLSLVDPLAPLNELALRRSTNTQYDSTSKPATNLIAPKVEALFGVPALSKHIAPGSWGHKVRRRSVQKIVPSKLRV